MRTLISCFALALGFAQAAFAQGDYPNKPVQLVVPFASGGPTDVIARQVGAKLGERLKQPVVIVNRPGAGGNLGSASVATAPADGYTLLLGTVSTHGINPSLYKNMPYDHRKDFAAVSQLTVVPSVLVVNKDFPPRSMAELLDYLKKNPGKVFYATPGAGTSIHLASELLKMMSGTDMTHVPYKCSAPAMIDVIGGQVQLMFDNTVTAWPQVQAGKVRALGVTTAKRTTAAPDIPTMQEAGLKDFELVLYSGILGPRGLPRAIVDRLNGEFGKAIRLPEIEKVYERVGAIAVTNSPEAFAQHITAEMSKLGKLVALSGARID